MPKALTNLFKMQRFVSTRFWIDFSFQNRWCRGFCNSWNLWKRSEGCSKIDVTTGTPYVNVSCKLSQFVTRKLSQISSKNHKKRKRKKTWMLHRFCNVKILQNWSQIWSQNASETFLKRALSASNSQLRFQDACHRCGAHLQGPATDPFGQPMGW